ncbi:ABC transporter permease [Methylobacterium sp. R2-1]|uniref:ABC transporter permease n=1 Tax=Methylobacterium sp. R2-1 TaxID=2587064 RepID=UPI001608C5CA|nr:ABC transporter permease [Methylobacterium sp. R2-1]MBB2964820.1 oligopeptide transport system permease protein [Methylobacterium sp. R2-1]
MSAALARRLARDRSALVALASLVLIALACLVGPLLTGHPPERIYPDFVRVAPSLAAHPRPDEVRPALTRLAFRMRPTLEDVALERDRVRLTLTAQKPIDERSFRLLSRSGLFGEPAVLERSADGRRLLVEAPLRKLTFVLGTDALGRDLLTRCLAAGQVSLLIGLTAALAALLIGVVYGAVSGMAGGTVDALMMRFLDILYALPFVFLVIMLLVFFRAGLWLVLVAVAAVEWLDMARIVRTQTLSLKGRDFVRAASALGAGTGTILARHIVPNTLGPIVAAATLLVPRVILLESFLSFLGLGVQEPDTSWGVLIAEGARALESAPWMLAAPAGFLVVTLMALNRLGDGLGEALDPRL